MPINVNPRVGPKKNWQNQIHAAKFSVPAPDGVEARASPKAGLSGSTHEHLHGRIEAAFEDLGEQRLKNIDRPVRAYPLSPGSRAVSKVEPPKTAMVEVSLPPAPERREPPRLSIIVLPFTNIGGDPEQDYFADGVTESLTTDLLRISGAFVIAINTAFICKAKAVDVRQIGRDLNVRHVLGEACSAVEAACASTCNWSTRTCAPIQLAAEHLPQARQRHAPSDRGCKPYRPSCASCTMANPPRSLIARRPEVPSLS
jgi:hypothetical protein